MEPSERLELRELRRRRRRRGGRSSLSDKEGTKEFQEGLDRFGFLVDEGALGRIGRSAEVSSPEKLEPDLLESGMTFREDGWTVDVEGVGGGVFEEMEVGGVVEERLNRRRGYGSLAVVERIEGVFEGEMEKPGRDAFVGFLASACEGSKVEASKTKG